MSFVPYQVDHSIQNVSKTIGFSKKKVVFKFGFANMGALENGLNGPQCRGSEHELTFIWSLKSGKRHLLLDGKEVHYSESGQNGWTQDRAWQNAFTMKDATGVYRVHFISQPRDSDMPDSKAFDMRVAGVSYFTFNRIFQLGTPTMMVHQNNRDSRHNSGRDSPMSPEEQRQVAMAKVESMRDYREHQDKKPHSTAPPPPPIMPRQEPDLLSFDDPPPPAPVIPPRSYITASTSSAGNGYGNDYASQIQHVSSVTLDSAVGNFAASSYGGPPPTYGQPGPYGAPNPWAPPAQSSYGQPHPVSQPYSNGSAMTTYQPPTGQPAPSPYAMPQTPTNSFAYPSSSSVNSGFAQMTSPSGQSYASYGSAPSFAQPPKPNTAPPVAAPAPGGYPATTGGYAAAPSSGYGGGYAAPAPAAYPPQTAPAAYPPQAASVYPPQGAPTYPPQTAPQYGGYAAPAPYPAPSSNGGGYPSEQQQQQQQPYNSYYYGQQ